MTQSDNPAADKGLEQDVAGLIEVFEEVARGIYSDRIMEFSKPDRAEIIQRIAEAMGMMMVKVEAREYRLQQLIDELKLLNEQIKKNTIQTVATIANALGVRDQYTQGHATRVAHYSRRLAARLGLARKEVEDIFIGGMLHDIGKIGFTDRMFTDTSKAEIKDLIGEIQQHPELGVAILKNLDFIGSAVDLVQFHHERSDGKGYPRGLREREIPVGAQIMAIADCFDAVTTKRSYQEARTLTEAYEILRTMARGGAFPVEMVELFIEDVEENGKA